MKNLHTNWRIIDSHCHINDILLKESFDIATLLSNAKENGVVLIQNICTYLNKFHKIYEIAEKYPQIFASVGTHPHNVMEDGVADSELIVKYASYKKVTSIGEVGLDYSRNPSIKEICTQKDNLLQHIYAAQETELPLIVHTRNAEKDTAYILQKAFQHKSFPIVMHCYTASRWFTEECLPIVSSFSASGIITFKNAKDTCDTFSMIPNSKLLIETDAPYLSPSPYRGKINNSAYLHYVCNKLAEIKKISFEDMARITTENFLRIFAKAYIK